ncbi:MAG: transglycosylase SLT domain-containing protein [Alphaproteobacteria bacterium]|jgi:hypothetical protein|nr:transglycosylase SLT domain-containing protein [Alphaproteobacteria bacterium]
MRSIVVVLLTVLSLAGIRPLPALAGDCLGPARDAARRHAVPQAIVEAMVWRESSNQPLAIGVAGRAVVAPDPGTAVRWIDAWRRDGVEDVAIDMGCMQINRHHHPAAFGSPESAFDAVANTEYGVRYLRALYDRYGDWTRAAAAYNCSRTACQIAYLCGLIEKMDRSEWHRQCVAPGRVGGGGSLRPTSSPSGNAAKRTSAGTDRLVEARDRLRRDRDAASRSVSGPRS